MSFWSRTLKIFRSAPVRIQVRGGRVVVGDIESVGETSCTLKKADGTQVLVNFDEILVCEPAVDKL
jgi:hypothetical protein